MGWAGHVACVGELRNAFRIFVRKLKGRDHLDDLGVGGRILGK
jgi:hypothetical protein